MCYYYCANCSAIFFFVFGPAVWLLTNFSQQFRLWPVYIENLSQTFYWWKLVACLSFYAEKSRFIDWLIDWLIENAAGWFNVGFSCMVAISGHSRQRRTQTVEMFLRRVLSEVQLASRGSVPWTHEGSRSLGEATGPARGARWRTWTCHAPVDLPGWRQ